jgi:hypothetical protein
LRVLERGGNEEGKEYSESFDRVRLGLVLGFYHFRYLTLLLGIWRSPKMSDEPGSRTDVSLAFIPTPHVWLRRGTCYHHFHTHVFHPERFIVCGKLRISISIPPEVQKEFDINRVLSFLVAFWRSQVIPYEPPSLWANNLMDYTITAPLDELEGFSFATYTTGGLPADKSWHSLIMKPYRALFRA